MYGIETGKIKIFKFSSIYTGDDITSINGLYARVKDGTVQYKECNLFNSFDEFIGATSTSDGGSGLVPQPLTGDQDKFLKGDGTWSEIEIPETLPNPQKLTFAGAVTAEYDGSGAVTVVIPEGSGGKSAYQYAQEGGYTGTEEEFSAKLAQEKFANPNALTFTGAATGTYDGSAAVSVEIPSGGDVEKRVRHIATVSVTAGTTSYSVTVDSNGDSLNLKSVYILTNKFWSTDGSYVQVKINGKDITRAYGEIGSPQAFALEKMGELQKFTNIPKPSNVGISFGDYYNGKSAVTSVDFWSASSVADTTIEIYGVDA